MSGQPVISVFPVGLTDSHGDRLARLFDAHHSRLYRLGRRLVSSADDALDLVQETFLRAARAPASIPTGTAGQEAWLVRIMINLQRDQWRQRAVRARHQQITRPDTWTPSHEAATVARTLVHRALEMLPPRRRAVIVMFELEGLTIAEIAALVGISSITVRWHLSKGRRDLVRLMSTPR